MIQETSEDGRGGSHVSIFHLYNLTPPHPHQASSPDLSAGSLLTGKLCEDCDQDLILQHSDPNMFVAALIRAGNVTIAPPPPGWAE